MGHPSRNQGPRKVYMTRSRSRVLTQTAVQGAVADGGDTPQDSNVPQPPLSGSDCVGSQSDPSTPIVEDLEALPYTVPSCPPMVKPLLGRADAATGLQLEVSAHWVDPEHEAFRTELIRDFGEAHIHTVDAAFAKGLYKDIVEDKQIDRFLERDCSGYLQGRWTELPIEPIEDSDLHGPLTTILSSISTTFVSDACSDGTTRTVVDSRECGFKVPEYADTCPEFSIKATGPSFAVPAKKNEYTSGVGFSNVSSVIDVMLDENVGMDDNRQVSQMIMYARHIFAQQPNRNFVRTLLVTETSARLFHFDRSGCWITPFVNIHDDPHSFVRWVIGVSSTDEDVLGFDTSITWSVHQKSGKRIRGEVEVDGVLYLLDAAQPDPSRMSIRGRGTTYWKATNAKTSEGVLIKDSWRPAIAESEVELLGRSQGLEGVVQLVSFQDHIAATSAHWPQDLDAFGGRVKSRVVAQLWEKSLLDFKSRSQALGAIRDAIIAHRSLYERDVIHRDITTSAIRLASGPKASGHGRRGALASLGQATWISSTVNGAGECAEIDKRTSMFSSIGHLSNSKLSIKPPHDILDDLESFFYVLLSIVLVFKLPGVRDTEMDQSLILLDAGDVETVVKLKTGLITTSLLQPQPWWGDACTRLIQGFQDVLVPIVKEKIMILTNAGLSDEEKVVKIGGIVERHGDVYERVLGAFDEALAEIEKGEENERTQSVAPESASARQTRKRSKRKAGGHGWSTKKSAKKAKRACRN